MYFNGIQSDAVADPRCGYTLSASGSSIHEALVNKMVTDIPLCKQNGKEIRPLHEKYCPLFYLKMAIALHNL